MALVLEKKDIHIMLNQLSLKYKVFAPAKKGEATVFEPFSQDMHLDLGYETTDTSAKKIFFPPSETLFSHKKGKIATPGNQEKIIIFGLHIVDAAALKILDEAFNKPIPDTQYIERRKGVLVVALEGPKPPNSFFEELEIDWEGVADVLLIDSGDSYIVETKTKKGEELIKNRFIKGKDIAPRKNPQHSGKKLDLKKVGAYLDHGPDQDLWKEVAEECLACGVCSYVCPICHCFDIEDKLNISGTAGERVRCWDSCMLSDFAKVAGGGNFRGKRSERIHNWYHHKFCRAVKERGKPDCVGCGRCITFCPAKIKIHNIIKRCEAME